MKFPYKTPQGESFVIEAASQDEADAMLESHVAADMMQARKDRPTDAPMQAMPPQAAPSAPPMVPPGIAPPQEGPKSILDMYRQGALGGAKNVYLGAKNLVGQGTPEDMLARQKWAKDREKLGIPGMVGEGVAEGLITLPIGGPVATSGKVLTKAVPALAKAAGVGGKVFNVGNVAKAGTAGALSQGVVGDATDTGAADRTDDLVEGGLLGAAGPAVGAVGATGLKLFKKLKNALSSSSEAVKQKAYDAFERMVGEEGMENALRKIEHSGKTVLPQTTAAMTGDQTLGALERGIPFRRNVDLESHYENVQRKAWESLLGGPNRMRSQAGKGMLDTFERNGIPVTTDVVGDEITGRVPALTDTTLRKAAGQASAGMTDLDKKRALNLADELRAFEKAKSGVGTSKIDHGTFTNAVSTALAAGSAIFQSTGMWKGRQVFNSVASGAKKQVEKEVDEALVDPQRFKALAEQVSAKLAAGKELNATDKAFSEIVLATSRAVAVQAPKEK